MKKRSIRKKHPRIEFFSSFEEENERDLLRGTRMTPDKRLEEGEILQERVWGKGWTEKAMKRVASFERVRW